MHRNRENYLKPGLKPSALNLCKPPSANVTVLTLPSCFTIKPALREAQLTSSKSSHGDLAYFHSVHLTDSKICHDMQASGQRGLTKKGILAQFNQSIYTPKFCLHQNVALSWWKREVGVWRSNFTKPLKKLCFWVPI